ncbi:MAG: Na+/H+ antiporter subunit E [Bacteroidota bacterium]|nr:Na+/H+ antiporter subunit E [Bacteroidota bacterium]
MKKIKIYLINLLLAYLTVYIFFNYFSIEAIPFNAATAIGLFFGVYTVLWLLSYFYHKEHFRKVPKIVSLIFFFIKELVVASVKVAYDVVTPKFIMKPAVIAFPLDASSDFEITMLASLISLTPGTLSIDVTDDRKILYVHAMYIKNNDLEELKQEIKHGFERRILEITR